jgi:hypothetical protein
MFLLIMGRAVGEALSALAVTRSKQQERHFIAFVIGIITLLAAVFFTDLFHPWAYIWMYVGATLRAVLIERSEAAALSTASAHAVPSAVLTASSAGVVDPARASIRRRGALVVPTTRG